MALDSAIALENLSQRLRGKKYAGDLAAFLFEALLDGHDASSAGYFLRAAQVLRDAVLRGEDVTEVVTRLPRLVKVAESIFNQLHMAQRASWDSPTRFLQEYVGNKLDLIFKFNSRIRVYRVGAETDNYYTRLNHNMPPTFAYRILAISEPPYEKLPETSCFILRAERVIKVFEANPEVLSWYRDELGLGSIVPETYTWHIGSKGLVAEPAEFKDADLLALSFDLGARQSVSLGSRDHLQCNHLLLRLVDLLLERGYAETIYRGLHSLIAASEVTPAAKDRTAPRVLINHTAESSNQGHIARQNSDGTPGAISYDTVEHLFYELAGAFLPAGFESEAWAYCADDIKALEVVSGWAKAVEQGRPSSVYLLGGSGTGKDLLARSIHTASVPTGRFTHFRPRNDPEVTHSMLEGAEAGAYTGVKEKKAVAEIAAGGTVFFDEFLNYLSRHPAAGTLVAGTIADLLDGREISTHNNRRKWKPQALLIFSGDPEMVDPFFRTPEGEHWDRRGRVHICLPRWVDLAHQSRIVIIRSLLLRVLAERGFAKGEIALSAVCELTAIAGNLRGNGGKLRNALVAALRSDSNGLISVEDLGAQLRDVQLRHSRNSGLPDRLVYIGTHSKFKERLTPTERIVERITGCSSSLEGKRCDGCIDEASLREAMQELTTAEEVLDLHYLLLGAVSHGPSPADDTYRSRPMRFQQHFHNKAPYEQLISRFFQATPSDLFVHGPNSQKHPLGGVLLKHVAQRVAELQSKVERIALAYPPFFHYVPYWGDALKIRG